MKSAHTEFVSVSVNAKFVFAQIKSDMESSKQQNDVYTVRFLLHKQANVEWEKSSLLLQIGTMYV